MISKERLLFLILLGVDALILVLETAGLSISHREAKIFFESPSFLHDVVHTSVMLFGQNDVALRLPMIVMHLMSVIFFYRITADYLDRTSERMWMVVIFMLLPGVMSSALLLDGSAFVIFAIFFYVYLYRRYLWLSYAWLVVLVGLDLAFALLYLALFFYALQERNNRLLVVGLMLFGASMYLHGFDTHGIPKGHFLDVLGLYAAIFSPIVFIYLVYTLLRRVVQRRMDLLWYLAAVPWFMSLLLSFRQELNIEMFAPYLLLAMPLAGKTFFHAYRVRLRPFRKKYRVIFGISLALLLLHAVVVLFHKELYRFLDDGSKHFAYRQHVAKELAVKLHQHNIECLHLDDRKMQLRLQFYGIDECDRQAFKDVAFDESKNVTIRYRNKVVYRLYVTK